LKTNCNNILQYCCFQFGPKKGTLVGSMTAVDYLKMPMEETH